MTKIWLIALFCAHLVFVFGLFVPLTVQAEDVTPMVAVSNSYTVTLKADGTVWSWGQGGTGEMGNGVTYDYATVVFPPVQASITDVKYIAIGNSCTYAIKTDGTLWAWGFNGNGELGVGDNISRNLPVQITGLSSIIQVSGSNGGFAVCLKDDGTVYAWGSNVYGQLGNGSKTASTVPVQAMATDFTDIRAIDAGGNHVVARKSDGTVWTWGRNDTKQCGRAAQTSYNTPGQITATGVQDVMKVRAGGYHTIVLKNGGEVWAWGSNKYGQLGNGELEYLETINYHDPSMVQDISGIIDINAGNGHTMIQKSDGSVWSVGLNHRGQFGDGNCLWANIPYATEEWQQALITGALMQLETFEYNTAFLKTDGSVWMCGANSQGQVGNGSDSSYVDVPIKVAGLRLSALGDDVKGDVDGNGVVNLADAVAVLQVLVGISPSSIIRQGADVNDDGVIGQADAIYILQSVAGFK